VITDVCLCQHTTHEHCGVVEKGTMRNDPLLELIARVAVSHAEAEGLTSTNSHLSQEPLLKREPHFDPSREQ
jgi:hypothetical protein